MIVAVELPKHVAQSVNLEAGRRGQTPSAWIADRLSDFFGMRAPARAATVKLFDTETDHAAPDREGRP